MIYRALCFVVHLIFIYLLSTICASALNSSDLPKTASGEAERKTTVLSTIFEINQAIQAAAERTGSRDVLVPPGIYRVDLAKERILLASGVTLRGAGAGVTIFECDDSRGHGDCIGNATGANTFSVVQDVHLRNFTVRGLNEVLPSDGSQLIRIGNCRNCSVEEIESIYSRAMGMVITNSQDVTIRGNRIQNTNSDGIAVWDTGGALISDNTISGANDDAISAHSGDMTPAPVRAGVIISRNIITESQGIHVLGAKSTIISENILQRVMSYGIRINVGAPQGDTAIIAVKISGNIIADVFRRCEQSPRNQEQYYIKVGGGPRAAVGGNVPRSSPTAGTSKSPSPYGSGVGDLYLNDNSSNTSPAGYGGHWVSITDNTLIRSLPAVASFSDWGHASSLFVGPNGHSQYYTGQITESALNTSGIILESFLSNVSVLGNIINTSGKYGIAFTSESRSIKSEFRNVSISGNNIANFSAAGIIAKAVQGEEVAVLGNTLDGDPQHRSPLRDDHATRLEVEGANHSAVGVTLEDAFGFRVDGNVFRNLASVVVDSSGGNLFGVTSVNLIYLNRSTFGPSKSTRTTGDLPQLGAGFRYMTKDGIPRSSLIDEIGRSSALVDSSQPSSGSYVAGTFVRNASPSVKKGSLLVGWFRLTNGSEHRSGQDWWEVLLPPARP